MNKTKLVTGGDPKTLATRNPDYTFADIIPPHLQIVPGQGTDYQYHQQYLNVHLNILFSYFTVSFVSQDRHLTAHAPFSSFTSWNAL
jgi:hypothetical protein